MLTLHCLIVHLPPPALSNKSLSPQAARHLPRPEDGPGDGSLPRLRARRPGSQPLHREVSPTRSGSGENQRHHVADPLRCWLPPQSPDRPQGFEATEYLGLPRGPGQAGGLWSGEDLRLQFTVNHRGKSSRHWPELSCANSRVRRWSHSGTGAQRSSWAPPTPPRWTSGAAAASWPSWSWGNLSSPASTRLTSWARYSASSGLPQKPSGLRTPQWCGRPSRPGTVEVSSLSFQTSSHRL